MPTWAPHLNEPDAPIETNKTSAKFRGPFSLRGSLRHIAPGYPNKPAAHGSVAPKPAKRVLACGRLPCQRSARAQSLQQCSVTEALTLRNCWGSPRLTTGPKGSTTPVGRSKIRFFPPLDRWLSGRRHTPCNPTPRLPLSVINPLKTVQPAHHSSSAHWAHPEKPKGKVLRLRRWLRPLAANGHRVFRLCAAPKYPPASLEEPGAAEARLKPQSQPMLCLRNNHLDRDHFYITEAAPFTERMLDQALCEFCSAQNPEVFGKIPNCHQAIAWQASCRSRNSPQAVAVAFEIPLTSLQ